ncbi:uncharacterized protein zc2hc1c [Lycodopsis pacificus]
MVLYLTNEYQDPRNDSGGRQPSGELQMARAIHAKELVLQEKLWRVEEKIRQKIQRDTAALDDQKSEEQRHNRGQAERGNYQRESRLSEQQRREPVRRREVKVQESREEDVKQHMKTQDQEERARGERREIESHKKGHKATHQITVPEQEVSGELNKPRRPDPRQEESTDTRHQLLLCKVCNRTFAGERLQKHVQICEKFKQTKRAVFNTYLQRTKGSALEEFLKTNSGGPEVLKKNNQRQNQGHTRNLQKGRKVPGGTAPQPK